MATDKLVIVESPAKAKTIGRILNGGYLVMASMGHVRDLPERSLGVDVENDFQPVYEESNARGKTLAALRKAAKGAKEIYLAPDPDREGEAIAWHLKEALAKSTKAEFHRVTFHEITKSAVSRSFESPGELNMDLVDSQQARRVLDRLVGYQVSRLLWSRIRRGISAGRVQSVALRIVCERERERVAFKPEEYWVFEADFSPLGLDGVFSCKLAKIAGQKAHCGDGDTAKIISSAIQMANSYRIASIDKAPRRKNPYPPFITSTMQQAASVNLGFGASRTMRVAQQLYEGVETGGGDPVGLITYMRTDSVAVAKEARDACRAYIKSAHGAEFVPAKPNMYRSRSSAQEAHEAIRPTDVNFTPERAAKFLDGPQLKLYALIWRRFVASQMSSARQTRTTVDVDISGADGVDYTMRAVSTVTDFPGFTKVYEDKEGRDGDEAGPKVLSELSEGMACELVALRGDRKETEPPPRFSEASLIRELEANGIGRPSTYASIVNTIQTRKYVLREKGRLFPTELGFSVNDYLIGDGNLAKLFNVKFTANMEEELDRIEEGRLSWTEMLKKFYGDFSAWVESAKFADAPDKNKAAELITLLDGVTDWAPPRGEGARKFDPKKFFGSIKRNFNKNGALSGKQWTALLRLAVEHRKQLPELAAVATAAGYAAELEGLINSNPKPVDLDPVIKAVFEALDAVEWDEPVKRGNTVYDDGKFINSLRSAFDGGKQLTPKQRDALRRLIDKYRLQLGDSYAELSRCLGGDPKPVAPPEVAAEISALIAELEKVEEWMEPVKRGRRVYDDQSFFVSLSDHFKQRGSLSDKQLAALKRMATKYMGGATAAPSAGKSPAAAPDSGAAAMIERLGKVENWADPTKKGKRVFDDKAFYQSLADQFAKKGVLSDKQLAALGKMVEKYCP